MPKALNHSWAQLPVGQDPNPYPKLETRNPIVAQLPVGIDPREAGDGAHATVSTAAAAPPAPARVGLFTAATPSSVRLQGLRSRVWESPRGTPWTRAASCRGGALWPSAVTPRGTAAEATRKAVQAHPATEGRGGAAGHVDGMDGGGSARAARKASLPGGTASAGGGANMDGDGGARAAVLGALQKLARPGDPMVLEFVIERLADSEESVRAAAVAALEALWDAEAAAVGAGGGGGGEVPGVKRMADLAVGLRAQLLRLLEVLLCTLARATLPFALNSLCLVALAVALILFRSLTHSFP